MTNHWFWRIIEDNRERDLRDWCAQRLMPEEEWQKMLAKAKPGATVRIRMSTLSK